MLSIGCLNLLVDYQVLIPEQEILCHFLTRNEKGGKIPFIGPTSGGERNF